LNEPVAAIAAGLVDSRQFRDDRCQRLSRIGGLSDRTADHQSNPNLPVIACAGVRIRR
jgi:hypothetical protein